MEKIISVCEQVKNDNQRDLWLWKAEKGDTRKTKGLVGAPSQREKAKATSRIFFRWGGDLARGEYYKAAGCNLFQPKCQEPHTVYLWKCSSAGKQKGSRGRGSCLVRDSKRKPIFSCVAKGSGALLSPLGGEPIRHAKQNSLAMIQKDCLPLC